MDIENKNYKSIKVLYIFRETFLYRCYCCVAIVIVFSRPPELSYMNKNALASKFQLAPLDGRAMKCNRILVRTKENKSIHFSYIHFHIYL
jgi:hypothetical protein